MLRMKIYGLVLDPFGTRRIVVGREGSYLQQASSSAHPGSHGHRIVRYVPLLVAELMVPQLLEPCDKDFGAVSPTIA
jgi:hypothetical protein